MRSRSSGLLARVMVQTLVTVGTPLAVAGAVVAAPTLAFAQEASPQDIAQARQLAGQGQTAFDAGNFAESEKLWSAAAKLYPQAPTLTLGLARAQAKAGHVVGAQESYNKIIREWSDKPTPSPAFKDALDAAKAEVGAVSARVASVVITVEGGAPNPQVTIDGQPVPSAALGLKRPVDPGQHTVVATAEGYKSAETKFGVAEAGNAETKLKLEKNPDAVVAPVPVPVTAGGTEPPPPGADGNKGSGQKTAALVAFGVGGVGLVVGAITGIIAIGKHGDLADKCTNGTCGNELQSDVDSYKSMGTISTIGFVVAALGAGTGAFLWFTAPKNTGSAGGSRYATVPAPAQTGVRVTPYLGAGAAGITGSF